MRRNGDIEHVRRSRRAGAQSSSLSPEERGAADEDTDAASDSSGAAAARDASTSDGQSKGVTGSQQKDNTAKDEYRNRSHEVAAEAPKDRARAATKQKKKRKKSGAAAATGPVDTPGSARKGARSMKKGKALQ